MGTKLNKVLGERTNCPSCGSKIICIEKPAKGDYPAKLQWQDIDTSTNETSGKAHYNFNDGQFTCRTIIEDPKNVRTPEAKAYAPKTSVTPEILRQESFADFDKVYSEAIPKAKAIADNILLSTDDRTKIIEITQRILRDYIHFYIARNF